MSEGGRDEPRWLTPGQVRMLHAETVRLFGGAPGVRDEGLLRSALARPRHRWTYGEAVSLFALAAAYASGIARNHPFVDGNKRTALLSIRAFLFRNGYRFLPDEAATVSMMEGLAAGRVKEDELASWIEASSTRMA
ncbi:type II toxin-antitoxin system death-on-curing family toxin [Rhodocaloribacter litoris]|uniref:type II toxin-antitoxin system death-on-curing family toxin n=1 Tax=Rhodocaloribacter litoris TaxID=2558931 RepID=UPI00142373C7|nr:type II toxin-antitoxin system death-on-curing family toxin [Rhodocaloribacter litoris]QXD16793.1 type II toxin-antitoxin system death-on-curing family toxin [Rhodocaloribacter litoris]